jgi:RNA polymerase subunit RPABC4/transcription elongation factor Spt4
MSGFLDLASLDRTLLYLTAFLGAFLAALWLSLVFWTARDIRARSQDRLARLLAPIVAALLGPPGLVVYLILRPARTLEEAYQHTLEEEALLAEVEERPVCPACGGRTQSDWQICAHCHTRLRKPCSACTRLLELPWQLCPYCGTPVSPSRVDLDLADVQVRPRGL